MSTGVTCGASTPCGRYRNPTVLSRMPPIVRCICPCDVVLTDATECRLIEELQHLTRINSLLVLNTIGPEERLYHRSRRRVGSGTSDASEQAQSAGSYGLLEKRRMLHFDIATRFSGVRMYSMPSETAGVDSTGSPNSFFASNSNCLPAFTT